jgi:large subunit ribosomal protein L46
VLVQSCGINMNTWIVGNAPIGHLRVDHRPNEATDVVNGARKLGDKTFFMKARIMAGQADLKGNSFGLKDFKWLAKEEIQKHVTPKYWNAIRNMFPER